MNRLIIQVLRSNEWCNVTTIPVEQSHNATDTKQKYRRAYSKAVHQTTCWRGYFTEPVRIAELQGQGGYREAQL